MTYVGINGTSYGASTTAPTNAGDYAATASFAGDASHTGSSGSADFTIGQANAKISVVGYSATYDGNAHGIISQSATGVQGEDLSSLLTVASITYTNAPGGLVHWTFAGNTNYYAASGDATVTINKADATVTVTPYSVTCDGTAHTATYTITGVNGETGATVGTVSLSSTYTNAGIYSSDFWSFTGTANYNNIASTAITDSIAKANATVVVTPYTVTYDGNMHTATYTITGVNGETGAAVGSVDVSSTTHTNAGTYTGDAWSFTGTANYNNIASTTITDTIKQAPSVTTTVGAGPFTSNGSAQVGGSGIVSGAGGLSTGATSLTYSANADGTGVADFIDAGTCFVTAHCAGDANHTASDGAAVAIAINKVPTGGADSATSTGSASVGGSGTLTGATPAPIATQAPPFVNVAVTTDGQEVIELVSSAGVLTQFDSNVSVL